jgi:3-oxoacyl-[acyl-carrier protein] reductase
MMSNIFYDFKGKTVVVTGAARGIGLEIGLFFQKAKANVYFIDFDKSELEIIREKYNVQVIQADVQETVSVDAVVSQVIADCGKIDILINNAGILRDQVVWKITDEDWDAVLNTHAGGTFRFTRACVPHFRKQEFGRIINITSYTGLHGNIGQANYATAKAGIIGFTKTVSKELARFGVTVNAISPNARTRMIEEMPIKKVQELTSAIPLGRFAEPSEMCAAIGFLASEEAGYITGIILPVDGGLSI